MEHLSFKKIRKWICLFTIFAGFSLQVGISRDDLISWRNPSTGMDSVIYTFGCIDGNTGDTICIPVTVENFNNIVIFQYEILWNSSVLDFIEVTNPGSPSINLNADFNLSGPNALKVIPLGFPLNGESQPDGTVLFEICFRIIGVPGSSSCIGISPYFDFETVDVNGVVPSDSVNCCMTVDNADNLVAFVTSCGPSVLGGNGMINVTAYGGSLPYNITWEETSSGSTGGPIIIPTEGGSNVLNVPAGNYDVLITDALGNTVMYNVDVSELALSLVTHLKDPTCYKFNNGTIWIKPVGGTEPYSYIWESLTIPNLAGSGFIRDAGDSSLVTSLPDGLYRILVKDSNDCEIVVDVILNDNPFIITVNDLIPATCYGAENGVIDLSISGATPDPVAMTYTISGNLTGTPFQINTATIALGILDPGNYQITISDNVSQCDTVYQFTIGYSDTISATINVTHPLCAGDDDGTVSIHGLTNGVQGPSYSYSIYDHGVLVTMQNNIGGFFNYSPLGAGDYMVIVEEGSCKSDSIPFSIIDPPAIVVTIDGYTPDNCVVTNTGDIWFEITGGTGPYDLDVGSGFQDGDTIFNIGNGNHILTVEDNNGCMVTFPFYMPDFEDTEDEDITFQIDGTPCEGGTVTVFYLGGALPPGSNAEWSPVGIMAPSIVITDPGIYSVDIFLNAPFLCILHDTVHIKCEEALDLDITVEQPICGEGAAGGPYTGTVIVDTSNAVAPVTFIWSFPDTTTSGIYTGLTPGKYYVTVTDAADSIAIDSFEIIAPNTLGMTFSNIDSTSCPGVCDGGVQIVANNGDASLDYFLYWDPVNPMADTGLIFNITNLCAGLNEFSVSQDGLCFYKDTIEIFAPDSLAVDLIQSIDVTCHGGSDGLLEVAGTGGTPGYTYDWVGGPNNALFSDIPAGTYTVEVTDSKNCIQQDTFTILEPDSLIASIDSDLTINLSCGGNNNGVITIEVSGGNPGDLAYTWNPDVSSFYQAVNLTAGDYFITVTDSKGCTDTTSFTLTSPPPIIVSWPEVPNPECFGYETYFYIDEDDISGGNGNYSFTINSSDLLEVGDTAFIPSGIFIVSVFDDRGCSSDTMYTIMEPNPIFVSIGPDDPVVDLGDSLYISGTVDQSDFPIDMTLWTSLEPLSCATCPGTWVFNALPAIYTWTVTDINGCTGTASITVNVDYDRDVYIPNIFSPDGDGRNDNFRIYTGPGVVSINYFNIYDRWGNQVHSETNLFPDPEGAGNWDGTWDGQELNPGVYVYVASISFIDNNTTLLYRGDITLIK